MIPVVRRRRGRRNIRVPGGGKYNRWTGGERREGVREK